MNNILTKPQTFFVGLVMGFLLFAGILYLINSTPLQIMRWHEQEIIKRGYGRYVIDTNYWSDGKPTIKFEWIEHKHE